MLPWTLDGVVPWNLTVIDKHVDLALNVVYGYQCNFACMGCCVGSNFVTADAFDPDMDTTLRAIERLPDILTIDPQGMVTLLGGEALMYWHDRIVPLVRKLRSVFPDAVVNVFSNGYLLNRYENDVIELMDELDVTFTVTKHLSGDLKSQQGQRWLDSVRTFLSNPRMVKIHDDHYHIKDNIRANMYFYDADYWYTWYKLDQGRPKPWNSKNPALSFTNGCASGQACSAMFENKLYKCSSLAMLRGMLSQKGQLDDPEWQTYLSAPYIDVLEPCAQDIENFISTYQRPISQCSMCCDSLDHAIEWSQRKAVHIIRNL